jgi:DNA-binding NarL/FixJ family response regulator
MVRAHRPDDLTERELEIRRLIALGHTGTEIAAGST